MADNLLPLAFIVFALSVALFGHWLAKRLPAEAWRELPEEPVGISLGEG